MESSIVRHLQPEFDPVAVVWSDTLPEGTVQYNKRKVYVFRPFGTLWCRN
jgi:hypothetical protein